MGVFDSSSEGHLFSKRRNAQGHSIQTSLESVYNHVNLTERFIADYIHSDISTNKRCSFNINSVYLLSTKYKKINLKVSLTNVSWNWKYKYYSSLSITIQRNNYWILCLDAPGHGSPLEFADWSTGIRGNLLNVVRYFHHLWRAMACL